MKIRDIPEATEAADPSTSPERLGNIADLYPELRPVLVLNPSCPEDLREWMRSTTPKADQTWKDHLAAERARQQAEAQQRDEAQRQPTSSQTTSVSPRALRRVGSRLSWAAGWSSPSRSSVSR
ncbi:variant leucine-rich repeat-containing protein [Actinomyces israelii]